MKSYDVIVAGAGPAGSVLAYEMARQGASVLLLEKEKLPRYKTCGGGLTFKAIKALPFDVSPVFERTAEGGILSFYGEEVIKRKLSHPVAWLVMRDRFDHFLVAKAQEAGVEVREDVRLQAFEQYPEHVSAFTTQGAFQGWFLVGADGVHSVVARISGLAKRPRLGVALEAEIAVPVEALQHQGALATFDFGIIPEGYGWVFPKRDHLSVGVFHAKSARYVHIRKALQNFIERLPLLREHEILLSRGHHIPLGGTRRRLHQGRVLLVGDAAHLADPFFGEGIAYAILSARLGARVLSQALTNGYPSLKTYSSLVSQHITSSFRWASLLARVVYAYPRRATFLLQDNPVLLDGVLDVLRGDLSFRGLVLRVLLQLPHLSISLLKKKAKK